MFLCGKFVKFFIFYVSGFFSLDLLFIIGLMHNHMYGYLKTITYFSLCFVIICYGCQPLYGHVVPL